MGDWLTSWSRVSWLLLWLGTLVACEGQSASNSRGPTSPPRPSAADPALPGLEPGEPSLVRKLDEARRARGPSYRARTRHRRRDGAPKYTNRLVLESSPYLLQHAHNPVNWYPWGDEAFRRARRENKPVLLSVGYSTCHWCHVMERESFEDEAIARYINRHFVAIKVDREERPDVDDVYMRAVQMLSGRGGWPMTVLLTPERQPFFGGTYFPARDGDRGAQKGFLSILRDLQKEFHSSRDNIVARAKQLTQRMAAASAPSPLRAVPGPEVIRRAAQSLAQSFDPTWGGFGRAPKFPRPVTLELLLRYHRRTGDAQALHMVVHTLDRMAAGGIYDHVGGGFHRYSTDGQWRVPHFEKMLYDNAQLVPLYVAGYQLTGRKDFAAVVRHTLEYVAREMTAPRGAFYSATDADSPTPSGEEEEGYFFTWTPAEVKKAVGSEDAVLVAAGYGVTARGNFEGRSILHRVQSDQELAAKYKLREPELPRRWANIRGRLYAARAKRRPPHRDDKILTSWNGLMISAFSQAALVLGEESYARQAERAASFVVRSLQRPDGRLYRTFADGQAEHNGYLDDYAFLIQGLLDLHEATSKSRWLVEAVRLQAKLNQHYLDESSGGYFLTSDDHERLLFRDKPVYDGAEPSGNSVAVLNLLRLSEWTGKAEYRELASRALASFGADLTRAPTASPKLLAGLDFYLDAPREVILVAPPDGGDPEPLLARFRRTFLPNRVFVSLAEGPRLTKLISMAPWLEGKQALGGRATAFVCERGRCELPTSDPDTFARQLAKVTPLLEKTGR